MDCVVLAFMVLPFFGLVDTSLYSNSKARPLRVTARLKPCPDEKEGFPNRFGYPPPGCFWKRGCKVLKTKGTRV